MRALYTISGNLPLIGHIAFGIIDRGTNLLQVRPTSFCPLSCIFCSVDAGPRSRNRIAEFMVDERYLVEWFVETVKVKKLESAHAYIDAVGDPLTHPRIIELVRLLKNTGRAISISLETHGALLTEKLAEKLEEAGLDRINLSIDSLDKEKARVLSGTPWFDVERVIKVAEHIAKNLSIDLLIAPVWVPGYNDEDISRIIEWALRIGAGKKHPPLGIQKYEAHKYGRKVPGVKPLRWRDFYKRLRVWEEQYGIRLILSPQDFGIVKAPRVPLAFEVGEKAMVKVVGPGWLKGQWLATSRNRVVTVVGVTGQSPVGQQMRVEIVRNKDNIYIAKLLW
ncbi:molybdenum cofactor biosynthesis protein MoaA [Infirmifilum uzonense]|uniref:Molybdenum cofactor biosynthesis protein MoaA n=1 Tax=Infirmifilum uzonense TaxID=1550241 RepID=A0A0F7CL70_9CREN|nr:radical SAM protein [Infirmifilum uzonense]AKG38896.1 molybdenum cofactor biosynthesis protein MoaA [Infirmifilum uzonense]